jgi:hypothetical protein
MMLKDVVEVADMARVLVTYNLIAGALLFVASEKLGAMAAIVLRVKRQSMTRLTRLSCATAGACLVALSLIVLTLISLKPS